MENPLRGFRRVSAPEKPLRDELLSIERLEQRAKSLAAQADRGARRDDE